MLERSIPVIHKKRQLNKKEPQGMIELHLGGCKQNNQKTGGSKMNYTQNEKIEQVTDTTMVVGVDIGSQIHYARAFDNRGRELTKRVFLFIMT